MRQQNWGSGDYTVSTAHESKKRNRTFMQLRFLTELPGIT